jgi:hypothetical protein
MIVAALARGLTLPGLSDGSRIPLLDLVASFLARKGGVVSDSLKTGTAHVTAVASLMLSPSPDLAHRASGLLTMMLADGAVCHRGGAPGSWCARIRQVTTPCTARCCRMWWPRSRRRPTSAATPACCSTPSSASAVRHRRRRACAFDRVV